MALEGKSFEEEGQLTVSQCSIKIKVDENYGKDRKYIFRSLKTFKNTISEIT